MPNAIVGHKGIKHLVLEVGAFVTNNCSRGSTSKDVLHNELDNHPSIIGGCGDGFHAFGHTINH